MTAEFFTNEEIWTVSTGGFEKGSNIWLEMLDREVNPLLIHL